MKLRNRLLLFLVICILLAQWAVPHLLLQASMPQTKESKGSQKAEELSYYIDTYEESLARFKDYQKIVMKRWPNAAIVSVPVGDTGLTLDYLRADAVGVRENLVVMTAGIHGAEGYAGSAMLDATVHEFLPELDPANTGLILVHAANPWGMENFRRYDQGNIDLNRNFIEDWGAFDKEINKDYSDLQGFFEKQKEIGNATLHELGFLGSLGMEAVKSGTGKIEDALLTGQYTHPAGVSYGGEGDAPSTKIMKDLYEEIVLENYMNIVHIDLHTGHGPRNEMSIFSSINETMEQGEAVSEFSCPNVLTPESEGFCVAKGDNTGYLTSIAAQLAPQKTVYSAAFEFGTLGDDTEASIKSLKNTIDENRLYHHKSSNKAVAELIENRYREMLYPSGEKWRIKAVQDFRQGLTGVLASRGILDAVDTAAAANFDSSPH